MSFLIFILVLFSTTALASPYPNCPPQTISTSTLENFDANPEKVKNILKLILNLSSKKIGYQYGSAKPESGGMDCSGTIYYALSSMGVKDTPRSSYELYKWVLAKGHFYHVNSFDLKTHELSNLKPGDLLFWSGTYNTGHDINVSHVMIYLGKDKDSEPLMAGASDGRTYKGKKIYGVSVFDFQLPNPAGTTHFLGYSCIPQISC
jgi:cell wall-associated NlpC family hydrolase